MNQYTYNQEMFYDLWLLIPNFSRQIVKTYIGKKIQEIFSCPFPLFLLNLSKKINFKTFVKLKPEPHVAEEI